MNATGLPYVEPPVPKTTFYIMLVFELRSDGFYSCSLDRCYTSLEQANERCKLLSRCNSNTTAATRDTETLRAGEDEATGCLWSTWTTAGGSQPRFFGQVKKLIMHGYIRTTGPPELIFPPGPAGLAQCKYYHEHKKDLANHVWAVAVFSPETKILLDVEGKPVKMQWELEGMYEASGNAMARGKRLWKEQKSAKEGPFDRLDKHYGFARYEIVPKRATDANKDVYLLPQIRIERMKVEPEEKTLADFVPAEAILYDKPFQPLCKEREQTGNPPRATAELSALFTDAGEEREQLQQELEFEEQEAEDEGEAEAEVEAITEDLSNLVPPSVRPLSRCLRKPSLARTPSAPRSTSGPIPRRAPPIESEFARLPAAAREMELPSCSITRAAKAMPTTGSWNGRQGGAEPAKDLYHSMVREHSRVESNVDDNGSPRHGYSRSFAELEATEIPLHRLTGLAAEKRVFTL